MTATVAIYPGTFDPITLGHMDTITRIKKLFDRVVVAISADTTKSTLFNLEERVELAKLAVGSEIEVVEFEGLLVDFAHRYKGSVIIRGIRTVQDCDFELQLAGINRQLSPDVETLFIAPSPQYVFLSSTLVRQIALLNGDVSKFVHPAVEKALSQRGGK